MSEKVTYNIDDVTGQLGAKIANLEVQLAHERAAKEAFQKRVQQLEKEEATDSQEEENAE